MVSHVDNRVSLVIFRGISGEIFPGCSDLDFPFSFPEGQNSEDTDLNCFPADEAQLAGH